MKARNPLFDLIDALGDSPEPPCEGCPNVNRCGAESLACEASVQYFRSPRGTFDTDAPRVPTRERNAISVGRVG